MRFIRHISFLMALFVLMGHDMIPHIDGGENLGYYHEPDHGALPNVPAQQENEVLGHIFSHLQHGTAERNLVYLGSVEKKGDFQANDFYEIPAYFYFADQLAWYSNYKKQHFPRSESPIPDDLLHAFSLRGPPAC